MSRAALLAVAWLELFAAPGRAQPLTTLLNPPLSTQRPLAGPAPLARPDPLAAPLAAPLIGAPPRAPSGAPCRKPPGAVLSAGGSGAGEFGRYVTPQAAQDGAKPAGPAPRRPDAAASGGAQAGVDRPLYGGNARPLWGSSTNLPALGPANGPYAAQPATPATQPATPGAPADPAPPEPGGPPLTGDRPLWADGPPPCPDGNRPPRKAAATSVGGPVRRSGGSAPGS